MAKQAHLPSLMEELHEQLNYRYKVVLSVKGDVREMPSTIL